MYLPIDNISVLEPVQTEQPPLVILLTSGPDDRGKKAVLAYSAAVTSVSMEVPTQIFLVGDGAHWAYEGNVADIEHPGFPPLQELIETFSEFGGETYICSTCAEVCAIPSDQEQVNRQRRSQVYPRGMASVLNDITRGSSVTF